MVFCGVLAEEKQLSFKSINIPSNDNVPSLDGQAECVILPTLSGETSNFTGRCLLIASLTQASIGSNGVPLRCFE